MEKLSKKEQIKKLLKEKVDVNEIVKKTKANLAYVYHIKQIVEGRKKDSPKKEKKAKPAKKVAAKKAPAKKAAAKKEPAAKKTPVAKKDKDVKRADLSSLTVGGKKSAPKKKPAEKPAEESAPLPDAQTETTADAQAEVAPLPEVQSEGNGE